MKTAAPLFAVVSALAYSQLAFADPNHNVIPPQTLSCDNGMTIVVNPGTVTNQSHEGFVIGSNSILVINYLALSNGTSTQVLFNTAPGLNAQGLITCSGDVGGGLTITVRGFLTPRS